EHGDRACRISCEERRRLVFPRRHIDGHESDLVLQPLLGNRDSNARGIRKSPVVMNFQHWWICLLSWKEMCAVSKRCARAQRASDEDRHLLGIAPSARAALSRALNPASASGASWPIAGIRFRSDMLNMGYGPSD